MLTSHSTSNISIEETLPQKICRLAEAGDENALRVLEAELEKENIYFSTFDEEGNNPLILLAKQGKKAAVELLINKFSGSRNHATQGYAYGGYHQLVDEQLNQGASPSYAAYGYALSGEVEYHEHVQRMIARGASKISAAKGYAISDQYEQVADLIRQGEDVLPTDLINTYLNFCPCDQAISHLTKLRNDFPDVKHPDYVMAVFSMRNGATEEENRQSFLEHTMVAIRILCDYLISGNAEGVQLIEERYPTGVAGGYFLALCHYAHQGELNKASRLLVSENVADSLEFVLHNFALHGHFIQLRVFLEKHCKGANYSKYLSSAAAGCLEGCHITQLNQLMNELSNNNSNIKELSSNIIGDINCRTGSLTLVNTPRIVFLIDNPLLRSKIVDTFMLKKVYSSAEKEAVKNKINMLIQLKQEYGIGIDFVDEVIKRKLNHIEIEKLDILINYKNNPLNPQQALAYLNNKDKFYILLTLCLQEESARFFDENGVELPPNEASTLALAKEKLIRPALPVEIIFHILSYVLEWKAPAGDMAMVHGATETHVKNPHTLFRPTVKIEEIKEEQQLEAAQKLEAASTLGVGHTGS